MFAKRDELTCLRTDANLFALLSHYAVFAEDHLEAWHGRLMHLDGVERPQMARLHGQLIALGWVEQNTGIVPARYRITLDGWRAIKQCEWQEGEAQPAKIAPPKFFRKKRRKSEPPTAASPTTETVTPQQG